MSTDLRALMRSLADDAPPVDDRLGLADRTYKAGRHRRVVRHAVVSTTSAVALLLMLSTALFVGPAPLAAQYGRSSGTVVSGYPKEIGPQWPVLDLPKKPGPIAALLPSDTGYWAVSATGHRWTVPGAGGGGIYPALSPDGRWIAYLDGSHGRFVLRDLVSGRVRTVPGIGEDENDDPLPFWIPPETPLVFSADDRYLAFTAVRGGVVVVDVAAAKVVATPPRVGGEWVAGWSGDRLVTASSTTAGLMSVSGHRTDVTLHPTTPLTSISQDSAAVAPDGTLVFLGRNSSGRQVVTRFALPSGQQRGAPSPVPSTDIVSPFTVSDRVYFGHRDPATGGSSLLAVDVAGRASTAVRVNPQVTDRDGIWAGQALSGKARARPRLDRLSAWVLGHGTWVGWCVALFLLTLVVAWQVRVVARQRDPRSRDTARHRRRLRWLVGGLAAVALAGAVLTRYVFVPIGVGSLSADQSPMWWSQVDQAAARPGSSEGDPTSVVPERPGQQQWYVFRVQNHTGHDQTIEPGPGPGLSEIDVSTVDGTPAEARSLTYRSSGQIPAHGARWVRVLIQTQSCSGKDKDITSVDSVLTFHVRIGWTTRSETVDLTPAMARVGVCTS
jgi:hypothetical protein